MRASPTCWTACAAWLFVVCSSPAQAQTPLPPPSETVADVRVHGNHTTPDEIVLHLAGVAPGQALETTTIAEVESRLRRSGRFRSVEVRKRYASIEDASRVLLVIVVEEHAAVSIDVPQPGVLRRIGASTMWQPVLDYEDGYGFTYGARVGFVRALGPRGRLSTPLTWGGTREAALDAEWSLARGPLTRVALSAGVVQREHPALDIDDRRAGIRVRGERAFGSAVRVGGSVSVHDVAFGDLDDRLSAAGVDVVLDTRRDPNFPRNAAYASVAWRRLWFDTTADTHAFDIDVRGYVGLFGQAVLLLRGQQAWAADVLPEYERPLLGGADTLRGYRLGYRAGDRLVATSTELRLPISSPLRIGRAGVALFWDAGAVYNASDTLDDARFDTAAGAGFFVQVTVLSMRVDVARRAGGGTRAHFRMGVSF